ncbi:MAG TPA: N4-gp56 family major capsid protein [Candidatus Glassbacteria bacterium]|nr:N4-gp56 family major capsid protein [Candidatus Glassbacteria bacterium]
MSVTTTSNYGSMSNAWAHRALLQRSKPMNVHNLFGRAFVLPQKNTDTMAFRRQENFNSDPVVLAEGVDPAPETVNKFDISVQIQEFGKVTLISRKVLLVVEDDTANEIADNLSQCMHTMLDKVTRDVWQSAVPEISCLNGINGNLITELTQTDVNRAISYLDENNTEKMTPTIEGTSKFGTGPVEAAFWVAAHVKLKPDIRALDAFLPTSQYGSQEAVLQAEFGSTDEARWVTSTLVSVTDANPPVYSNTFIGANAYGYVGIDQVSTEIILKPLGFNDYLNRYQSMGFTAWFNAAILDDSHIVSLLSTKA